MKQRRKMSKNLSNQCPPDEICPSSIDDGSLERHMRSGRTRKPLFGFKLSAACFHVPAPYVVVLVYVLGLK